MAGSMRKLTLLLAALVAACLAVPALAATEGGFAWARFTTPEQTFDHAALLVPVTIDGVPCTAQLDTGANYAFMDRQRDADAAPGQPATLRLGDLHIAVTLSAASMQRVAGHACANIGRIGNALFDHGILVLDLRTARYAWYARAVLADDAGAEHLVYRTPDGWDGGLLIVSYRVGGGPPGAAYLDTGAAIFAITTTDAATLASLAPDDFHMITAPSTGQTVGCRIAPLTGVLQIGASRIASGLVGSCFKPLPDVGGNVSGVVGLGGFANRRLTIDYVAQKWLVE